MMRALLSAAAALLLIAGFLLWFLNRDHAALWCAMFAINLVIVRPTEQDAA